MEAIYPISALHKSPKKLREVARAQVVHVTENGAAAYVFCSEEVFDQKLKEAAEEAAYAERMASALRQSRADIAAGRFVQGTESAKEAILKMRAQHG